MFNKILSSFVIISSIVFASGLISNLFTINNIGHWPCYLIFLMLLLLLIVVYRFKEIKDKTGIHLTYIGIFSFIIAPFFPMFIVFLLKDSSFILEGSLLVMVDNFLPSVGLIMSICVAIRLLLNKKAEVSHNGSLYI